MTKEYPCLIAGFRAMSTDKQNEVLDWAIKIRNRSIARIISLPHHMGEQKQLVDSFVKLSPREQDNMIVDLRKSINYSLPSPE